MPNATTPPTNAHSVGRYRRGMVSSSQCLGEGGRESITAYVTPGEVPAIQQQTVRCWVEYKRRITTVMQQVVRTQQRQYRPRTKCYRKQTTTTGLYRNKNGRMRRQRNRTRRIRRVAAMSRCCCWQRAGGTVVPCRTAKQRSRAK